MTTLWPDNDPHNMILGRLICIEWEIVSVGSRFIARIEIISIVFNHGDGMVGLVI